MKKIYIDSEESLKNICSEYKIPFPSNNISNELKEILESHIIVFENWFWNLNPSHLKGIFQNVDTKKIFKQDNLFKILTSNNVYTFKNIDFLNEIIWLTGNISFINCKWKLLTVDKNWTDNRFVKFEKNRIIKEVQFKNFDWESKILIDSNSRIEKLSFIDFNTNWVVDIRTEQLKSLKIINSHIESRKVNFFNININWLTDILDSDLGETKFNWILFGSLKLRNSSLVNTVFNWCSFPKQLEDFGNENKQKDNYRQLKFVMEKNWNKIQADKFYELEMNSELASISTNLSLKKLLNLDYWLFESNNISRKIPLTFSKILTNFGNNWIPAFIILNIFVLFSTFSKSLYYKLQNEWINLNWNIYTSDNVSNLEKYVSILFILILIYAILKLYSLILNKYPLVWFVILILLIYFTYGVNLIWEYIKLLINPFYWFKDLINNVNNFNWLELISFASYKILYWIILWHLVVALKRTTRR